MPEKVKSMYYKSSLKRRNYETTEKTITRVLKNQNNFF